MTLISIHLFIYFYFYFYVLQIERSRNFVIKHEKKFLRKDVTGCTFIATYYEEDEKMFFSNLRCRTKKLPTQIKGCIIQTEEDKVEVLSINGDDFKISLNYMYDRCERNKVEIELQGQFKDVNIKSKKNLSISEIIHILANSSNMNKKALEMVHTGIITHGQFKNLQTIAESQMILNTENLVKEQCKNVILKPWQKLLEIELDGIVDPRKIIWIVDPIGNTGKSFFSNYMLSKYPEKLFVAPGGGKSKDLFHAAIKIRNLETVIFDFPRSKEQYVCYEAIEQFKDGLFCSTKYNSATINLGRKLNVVVLSNWEPNTAMLSIDRWDIRRFDSDSKLIKDPVKSYKRKNSFMDDNDIDPIYKRFAFNK